MMLTQAAAEYASRPKDECYPTPDAMIAAAIEQKNHSKEKDFNYSDLRFVAEGNQVKAASPRGTATFTNYAFGQACTAVGAPAGFVRLLTPPTAAAALNERLATRAGDKLTLLVQEKNGIPEPQIRSWTSQKYARLWDSVLHAPLNVALTDAGFTQPPTWSGEPAGCYRGDRSSFLISCNGGSIVTDPSAGDSGQMYRAVIVRNSEVGASGLEILWAFYRFVCGNHNLWDAMVGHTFYKRHIGDAGKMTSEVMWEVRKMALEWLNRPASADEQIVRQLIDKQIATTRDEVISELRKMGASESDANAAYDKCEATESASPRSFWGVAQGITRMSQDSGYQDERYDLDRLAMKVLARGRQLVTV